MNEDESAAPAESPPVETNSQPLQTELEGERSSEETLAPSWRAWLSGLGGRLKERLNRPKPAPTNVEAGGVRAAEAKIEAPVLPSRTGVPSLLAARTVSEVEAEPMSNARDFNPLPAEAGASATSSEEIFAEIGRELRKRREMLSLAYEEVERHTHVRAVFLKALEAGALDDLPSPVQTRGILANYAGFLDLDVDAILLRFADGLQARYREKRPPTPRRTRAPMTVNTSLPPLRSFIASDLVFGGGMAIMLLLFAVWGINRVMSVRSTTPPRATSPAISDVLAGAPLPTLAQEVTLIPAQDAAQAFASEATATVEAPTLAADISVQVNLTSVERTYMRVLVDGELQFEGRTTLGSTYEYQAEKQIEILVGNAAAIKVIYNGHDLGLMGNFGEVVDRVYSAEGVATPTSTPPPSPTATPNVTSTPTQTPTPTPSVTPTPNSGG